MAEDSIERTDDHHRRQERGLLGPGDHPRRRPTSPSATRAFPAYNVGKHRHTPEIDQILTDVGRRDHKENGPVEVIFTPHLVPMDRGIFATIYATHRRAQ